jgi:hypothetical protein
MKTEKEIIECKVCGVGSDVMYVNQETGLCKADSTMEDEDIIFRRMKKPDDVAKLHKTLESIFGEQMY